jgi:hypothetical protein
LVEIGIPKLTLDQITELCEIAETAARKNILSKVPKSKIVTLDVVVKADGIKIIQVNIGVNVVLSPLMKGFDVDTLTNEATKHAFIKIEEYLRELKCKYKKY